MKFLSKNKFLRLIPLLLVVFVYCQGQASSEGDYLTRIKNPDLREEEPKNEGLWYFDPTTNSMSGYKGPIENKILIFPNKIGGHYLKSVNAVDRILKKVRPFYHVNDFKVADMRQCEQLVEIGEYAFYRNYDLTEILLPESMETIGFGAFYRSKLESIKLPEGIKFIKEDAFAHNNITEVEIPAETEEIDHWAFYNNKDLAVVVFKGQQPPGSFSNSVFFNTSPNLRIFIPEGSKDLYRKKLGYLNCRVFEYSEDEEFDQIKTRQDAIPKACRRP